MYAVIQTGGKQYRVAPGDTIRIERVKGDVGEQVKFGTVLAVHTEDKKILAGVGRVRRLRLRARSSNRAGRRSSPC